MSEAAKATQELQRWVGHWVKPLTSTGGGRPHVGEVVQAKYPYVAVEHRDYRRMDFYDPNELTIVPAPPGSLVVESVIEYLEAPLTYLGFVRDSPRPYDSSHFHFHARMRADFRRLRGRDDIYTWSSSISVHPSMFEEMQQLCLMNQMRREPSGAAGS